MEHISELSLPGYEGTIGLFSCPGWRYEPYEDDPAEKTDPISDVDKIRIWGAELVISLITSPEFAALGVEQLGEIFSEQNIQWKHMPIKNYDTPDGDFAEKWPEIVKAIRGVLTAGGNVGLHCKGGYGRSGTFCAMFLVEEGMEPEAAIAKTRSLREGTIETAGQEQYIFEFRLS